MQQQTEGTATISLERLKYLETCEIALNSKAISIQYYDGYGHKTLKIIDEIEAINEIKIENQNLKNNYNNSMELVNKKNYEIEKLENLRRKYELIEDSIIFPLVKLFVPSLKHFS